MKALSILVIFFSFTASATTLQALARKANLVLVAADSVEIQTKCHLTSEKISALSQELKIKVDEKISKLGLADFAILQQREASCEADCTCTIYALAYESRGQANKIIEEKAQKTSAKDRLRCSLNITDICRELMNP